MNLTTAVLILARDWSNLMGGKSPRQYDEKESEFFKAVGEFVTSGRLFSVWTLVVLLLLLGAGVGGWWLHRRWKMRDLHAQSMLIYREVASEFGLKLRDQWLLFRVARHATLPTPLTLFMSVDTYQHHVDRFLAAAGPKRQQFRDRLLTVRRQLFGRVEPRGDRSETARPRRPVRRSA